MRTEDARLLGSGDLVPVEATGFSAVGYYYNLTFVQLGLVDLGTWLIGMSEEDVAAAMAGFALVTCIVALLFGWQMQRQGWSQQFFRKLRFERFAFWVARGSWMRETKRPGSC